MNATGSAGPQVRLTSGSVRGRTEDGLAVFRGMPFARPPVGELRLAAPMPVEPWDGVREAVAFGPAPPQFGQDMGVEQQPVHSFTARTREGTGGGAGSSMSRCGEARSASTKALPVWPPCNRLKSSAAITTTSSRP